MDSSGPQKITGVKVFWLCNGKACPAGTVYCAVQDPASWPDGCRHTQNRTYAKHPANSPRSNPEGFAVFVQRLPENKAELCFIENEEDQ